MGDLWVFGYGSLIWNPDFPVAEQSLARLDGWRRGFCMRSVSHRGTRDAPGLVLALDAAAGAHCDGVAFRVAPGAEVATREALRARELVTAAYLERDLRVRLADGRRVTALTFVIDRDHPQYCGALPEAEQARIIADAVGGRGRNDEYLWNTAEHLAALGIADEGLTRLAALVRASGRMPSDAGLAPAAPERIVATAAGETTIAAGTATGRWKA